MFKKFIVSGLCLLMVCVSAMSQNIDMDELKTINDAYYKSHKQVIKIDFCTKTRHVTDSMVFKKLVYLGQADSDYKGFAYVDSFSNLHFKIENYKAYYRHRDSLNYILWDNYTESLNWFLWDMPGELFFMKFLPVAANSAIYDKGFVTVMTHQSKSLDTIRIIQKLKKSKLQRTLFLDSFYRIFRVEYHQGEVEDLTERWSVNFKVYQDMDLASVGDSLNYGPYRAKKVYIKPKIKPLDLSMRNQISLLNGTKIWNDTLRDFYYIIDFWYLGCKPCHLMRPHLEKLFTSIDTSKAKMFGYDPYDKVSDINKFIQLRSYLIPEIDKQLYSLEAFGIHTFPTVLILDKNFKIVKTFVGYSEKNAKLLKKFLKGKGVLRG